MSEILVIIAAILVSMMLLYKQITYSLFHDLGNNEEIYGKGKLKCLILYVPYKKHMKLSLDGKHTLQKELKRVIDYLIMHNYTVTLNYPSKQNNYDFNEYDLIIVGSPVYFGQTSPILAKYIEKHPVTNKQIIVFSSGGLANETNEVETIKYLFDQNNDIKQVKITSKTNNALLEVLKKL